MPNPLALTRRDWMWCAALAGLVFVCGLLRLPGPVCGAFHDDAIYVATAQALATGEGYRLINLPGEPLQTKYPILYPVLLAAVWKLWPVFPANLLAMQLLTLATWAGTVGIGCAYLLRFGYARRAAVFSAGLILAAAPTPLFYATQTMSEMPFALLLVAVLWALEAALAQTELGLCRRFGLGLLCVLPVYTRTLGIVAVPAVVGVLWWSGRPWKATAAAAGCALTPILALLVLRRLGPPEDPTASYYTDYLGDWAASSLPFLVQVVVHNLLSVLVGNWLLLVDGADQLLSVRGRSVPPAACFLLAALVIAAAIRNRIFRPLPVFLGLYCGAICLWPWPPFRFLIPVSLYFVALGWESAWGLAERCLARRWVVPFGAAGCAVLFSANFAALVQHWQLTQSTNYPFLARPERTVAFDEYQRLFDWLRDHTRREDVVASGLDPMVFLYTGRQAFRPFWHRPAQLYYGVEGNGTGPYPELRSLLEASRADYLVCTPMPGFGEEVWFQEAVGQLHASCPDAVRLVYRGGDERFVIFRLDFARD